MKSEIVSWEGEVMERRGEEELDVWGSRAAVRNGISVNVMKTQNVLDWLISWSYTHVAYINMSNSLGYLLMETKQTFLNDAIQKMGGWQFARVSLQQMWLDHVSKRDHL